MTIDQAIARIRAIQADLDAGRLTVPYPATVRSEIVSLSEVFSAHCKTTEQARALVARVNAPATAELPW
jgi:hypothetical protein